MDASTLFTRLETATASFRNLERQLADPDVAADPKRLESIARELKRRKEKKNNVKEKRQDLKNR